jgi:tetratricopeptide (TPR) repeat protein
MQQPHETQLATAQSSWMNKVEIASVLISFGGSVASVMMQQFAYAVIPLSLTAAMNLANRRRLINAIEQSQHQTNAQLVAQIQQQQKSLEQQTQTTQTEFETIQAKIQAIQAESEVFNHQLQGLDEKGNNIETVLEKLREIDRCTQAIRTNPKAAELFFQRGQVRQSLQRMEDARLAIEDYSQAIELAPTIAKAYFHRGLLRTELGEKRQAGEDLRTAAKHFFDQGEMDNYAEAKRLSEQIFDKFEPRPEIAKLEATDEKLRAADLFA